MQNLKMYSQNKKHTFKGSGPTPPPPKGFLFKEENT
jgi:hypothetical protein